MSRKIACLSWALLVTGLGWANDPEILPPGHKPFHSPKAPTPNGVFAQNACFGYHGTRWTPWNAACGNCVAMAPAPVGQSCTSSAIIFFDDVPATTTAPATVSATPRSVVMPAPESNAVAKPMPPVKK